MPARRRGVSDLETEVLEETKLEDDNEVSMNTYEEEHHETDSGIAEMNSEEEMEGQEKHISDEELQIEKTISEAETVAESIGEKYLESVIDENEFMITEEEEQQEVLQQVAASVNEEEVEHDLLTSRGITEASGRMKKRIYRNDNVIPLKGDSVAFDTAGGIRREEYLHLVESQRGGKICTGTVIGTCVYGSKLCAMVKYGRFFRVLIPYEMFMTETDADREYRKTHSVNDYERRKHFNLNRRIASEVDFLVMNIDEEAGFAVGNRISAMQRMMNNYFYGKDPRNGKFIIEEGTKLEARVVMSTSVSITVEVRGIECKLFQQDISYNRIPDVSKEYPVGKTVPVVIKNLERKEKKEGTRRLPAPDIKVSIKEALPDMRARIFNFYQEGTMVVALVTGIAENGIYCRLEDEHGEMDLLCSFSGDHKSFMPEDTLPSVGDRVLAKILAKDKEALRIYGRIMQII